VLNLNVVVLFYVQTVSEILSKSTCRTSRK